MPPQIGFIGLGIMGKPMSKNLLKAGYPLTVYDIRPEPVGEVVAEGASKVSSCKEVAERSEIVITMVPDSPDSEKAILAEAGVLEGAKAGTIIIDMSSINPLVSQKIAIEAAEKGVEMLDAPVSGGEPGAIAGTLAIMVGASRTCSTAARISSMSWGRAWSGWETWERAIPPSWPTRSAWR